ATATGPTAEHNHHDVSSAGIAVSWDAARIDPIDLTYYGLVFLSWTGLVWDLRSPPRAVRDRVRARMAETP
ncbi:MAG TPA: hypothetical protein VLT84_01495, partial [Acidobacteriota bacterium]|nr:hypothetical protein [Acidobacteriota bacterium]